MLITVQRKSKTADGIFGVLTFDGFTCFTVENLAKAIEPRTYTVKFDYSPRFQRILPHIIVPSRDQVAGGDAGIRIHPANFPHELEGCIAVGDKLGENCVEDSRDTFAKFLQALNNRTDLAIQVLDIV